MYWSKYHFDSQKDTKQKFVEDHQLVEMHVVGPVGSPYEKRVADYIARVEIDKAKLEEVFAVEMASHFRRAAAICGMKHPGGMNDMVRITKGSDIPLSIANDPSEENIERLCWLYYCSPNTVHKSIYGMEMNEHYEIVLMDRLGVAYREYDTKVGKGCVSMFLNSLLNKYRGKTGTYLKSGKWPLHNVCSNTPKGCIPVKAKKGCPLFWVGTNIWSKSSMESEDIGDPKEIPTVMWRTVSERKGS